MSTMRLMKEYTALLMNPLDGVIVSGYNPIEAWCVDLQGPIDTPYEGGLFKLKLEFPGNYPFRPPAVRWMTKIYHPSIFMATGEMCQCSIKNYWRINTTMMRDLISFLKTMLVDPRSDPCSDSLIFEELMNDRPSFIKKAKEYTRMYAKKL